MGVQWRTNRSRLKSCWIARRQSRLSVMWYLIHCCLSLQQVYTVTQPSRSLVRERGGRFCHFRRLTSRFPQSPEALSPEVAAPIAPVQTVQCSFVISNTIIAHLTCLPAYLLHQWVWDEEHHAQSIYRWTKYNKLETHSSEMQTHVGGPLSPLTKYLCRRKLVVILFDPVTLTVDLNAIPKHRVALNSVQSLVALA